MTNSQTDSASGISFYGNFLYRTQKLFVTIANLTNNYCEQYLYCIHWRIRTDNIHK